jgi:hypothetical protein
MDEQHCGSIAALAGLNQVQLRFKDGLVQAVSTPAGGISGAGGALLVKLSGTGPDSGGFESAAQPAGNANSNSKALSQFRFQAGRFRLP